MLNMIRYVILNVTNGNFIEIVPNKRYPKILWFQTRAEAEDYIDAMDILEANIIEYEIMELETDEKDDRFLPFNPGDVLDKNESTTFIKTSETGDVIFTKVFKKESWERERH